MRLTAIFLALAAGPAGAGALAPRLALDGPRSDVAVIAYLRSPAGAAPNARACRSLAHATQAPVLSALARLPHSHARPLWVVNAVAFTGPPATVRAIAARPDIATVDLDETGRAVGAQGDSSADWNIARIGADVLHAEGTDGTGVTIGVIDTGVDPAHPDLAGKVSGWTDAVAGQPAAYDDSGHGTHVAGILCGDTVGVAPGARLLVARALDGAAQFQASWVLAAGQWMADPNGDGDASDAPAIVNGSWSFDDPTTTVYRPVLELWRAEGIWPVFAAGNSGPGAYSVQNPAADPLAIDVGMTTAFDTVADVSSRGPAPPQAPWDEALKPDVAAPGVSIRSCAPGGGYAYRTGTSMAAPHVAGALALVRQAWPSATFDEARARVCGTAVDLGPPGPDPAAGWGRLDAHAAVHAVPGYTAPAISGVVRDAGGRPIRDAIIDAGGTRVLTGTDGRFAIPNAGPGPYSVTADAPGFAAASVSAAPGTDAELTLADRIETEAADAGCEAGAGWTAGGAAGGTARVETANRTPGGAWCAEVRAAGDGLERWWLSPAVPVQSDGLAAVSVTYAWRGTGSADGRIVALVWLDGFGRTVGEDSESPYTPATRGGPADGAWRAAIHAFRTVPPAGSVWLRVRLGAVFPPGDMGSAIDYDDVTVDVTRLSGSVAVTGTVTAGGAPLPGAVVGEFPLGARYAVADAAGRFVLLKPAGPGSLSAWAPGCLPSAPQAFTAPANGAASALLPAGPDAAPGAAHAASSSMGQWHTPDLAADGDPDSYWSSLVGHAATSEDPTWWQADLGSVRTLQSVEILWEARPALMRVSASGDGSAWTPVASGAPGGFVQAPGRVLTVLDMGGVSARFVRVEDTMDGLDGRMGLCDVTLRVQAPPGDVDGDGAVTAQDAALALRMAGGLATGARAADYDSDGRVTPADAAAILRTAGSR